MVTITKTASRKLSKGSKKAQSLEHDSYGVPRVNVLASKFDELMKIDTGGDRALEQQKRQLLVEHFMLIGVRSQTMIGTKLNMNRYTVRKYIKQIEFRWSVRSQTYIS